MSTDSGGRFGVGRLQRSLLVALGVLARIRPQSAQERDVGDELNAVNLPSVGVDQKLKGCFSSTIYRIGVSAGAIWIDC